MPQEGERGESLKKIETKWKRRRNPVLKGETLLNKIIEPRGKRKRKNVDK